MYTEMISICNKIGVIVPVYKTEKYVAECIESILAQTYTNFRLILVDDGSPDGAGAICDEYATKDPRITVIHQKNAGVTRARARGVEEATDCEWITFVDSDDIITHDALKLLIKNSCGYDIVGSNIIIINHKHEKVLFSSYGDIDSKTIQKSILKLERKFSWELCGKIYKKDLFKNNILNIDNDIKVFEDYIATLRLLKKVKNVKIIKDITYKYLLREGNATSKPWCTFDYVTRLSTIIQEENSDEFPHETFKNKCIMLSWVIGCKELDKKSLWWTELLNESKKHTLNRYERLSITLVRIFDNHIARKTVWDFLIKIRSLIS